MFQRLKGAIDSRIAEEQARQRSAQGTPSRSDSGARRPSSRASSPAVRSARAKNGATRNGETPPNSLDPAEFDREEPIDEDDISKPAEAPRLVESKEGEGEVNHSSAAGKKPPPTDDLTTDGKGKEPEESKPPEMPADVRVKLRKLERLESRYQELLRSYRIAHSRVSAIEPFEASLRENTPLTSIGEPGAFVEYLNQINLKGDMVLDELKRVSKEKADYKTKWEEAEKKTRDAWDEVARLHLEKSVRSDTSVTEHGADSDIRSQSTEADNPPSASPTKNGQSEQTQKSPLLSAIRSPSISGISLFSAKSKHLEVQPTEEVEEFFSYDNELPRLEVELKARQEEVLELREQVINLTGDLAVARESTQSMVQSLEDATRELNTLREQKDKFEISLAEQRITSQGALEGAQADLDAANENSRQLAMQQDSGSQMQISRLEDLLEAQKIELEKSQKSNAGQEAATSDITKLQSEMEKLQTALSSAQDEKHQDRKRVDTLNRLVKSLREEISKAEIKIQQVASERDQFEDRFKAQELEFKNVQQSLEQKFRGAVQEQVTDQNISPSLFSPVEISTGSKPTNESVGNKKKNKKKKKPTKALAEHEIGPEDAPHEPAVEVAGLTSVHDDESTSMAHGNTIAKLQNELNTLSSLLEEKDAAVERLHAKLKNGEELQEEIESLRDDLIHVGQEHVEAKDRIKELLALKGALENTVSALEKNLADLRTLHASNNAGCEEAQKDLAHQLENLKQEAKNMQTDLIAAQQLASSRYKDLGELRTFFQKAQPELLALRSDNQELKTMKEELSAKVNELQRIEARNNTLLVELGEMKRKLSEKESEARSLAQQISQESNKTSKAEEACKKAIQDQQRSENEKNHTIQSLERASTDLTNAREELNSLRVRHRELEDSHSKLRAESEGLREDIELKTAQHASAESLMSSMRDQTTEMATQTKETRERCESLEEEVADAHRLLNERTREGETMRRLLAELEGRAETRIREMKDRMDTAIEERDRAEDEASTIGRRRTREIEELRNKLRDAERNLKAAEQDKEELEIAQRDWKKRRGELEQTYELASKEAEVFKKAMSELRDALDDSEKQARELEKQKAELRRSVEETQQRLNKLQKANKLMAEEARSTHTAKNRIPGSQAHSPRPSFDLATTRTKIGSPPPTSRTNSMTRTESPNPQGSASLDFVYLKNILLQFLEQKDKKLQMQLVPVLGMILHFDRTEEQKWMAAISIK